MARVQASSLLTLQELADEVLRLGHPDPALEDPDSAWGELQRGLGWLNAHFLDEAQSLESRQAYLNLVWVLNLAQQQHPDSPPLQALPLVDHQALAVRLGLMKPGQA